MASTNNFPTGATVPFPYETPYPQQTALMDTLLQCLQQKEQEDLQPKNNDGTTASNNDNVKRSRAAVMMLESPTGTGKSLSLACSAMAWLKYCEERDLAAADTPPTKTTPATNDNNNNNNNNNKNNNGDDWWNAWVPPETKQREEESQISQKKARETRAALQEELELWRNKIYQPNSNTTAAITNNNESKSNNNDAEKFQHRRENFVRSAVNTAKLAEKSGPKRQRKGKKPPAQREDDFCVTDYHSDPEGLNNDDDSSDDEDNDNKDKHRQKRSNLQNAVASELLDGHRLDGSHRDNGKTATTISQVKAGSGMRKIVYAARTHSQLSQFCGELKRTHWGETTRVVALGSRQLLCGNTALKKRHPTEASLTEACLDLKQGKSSSGATTAGDKNSGTKRKETEGGSSASKGCPLLESKEAVATLGLHLLTTPSDIEDAARLGKASHTCAYYASRKALAAAEVVVLPYSMLLSRPTREAIGLSLKECLVLVDEAHNIPEALRQLHSSSLSLPVIEAATLQLKRYVGTYSQRLNGQNVMYTTNLLKLLKAFAKFLKGTNNRKKETKAKSKSGGVSSSSREKENQQGGASNQKETAANTANSSTRKLQSTNEFLLELKLGNINLFKLQRYLEHSRLSQKLLGFTRSKEKGKDGEEDEVEQETTGLSKHVSAMSIVQTFLEKLNLKGNEGKIVIDWPSSTSDSSSSNGVQHPTLRYVLLQPASCFDNVLEEAHALALVGGTLAPFGHVAAELLAEKEHPRATEETKSLLQLAVQADRSFQQQSTSVAGNSSSLSVVSSRFAAFTCDHVIDKSRVFLKCLSFGPNRVKFDFRHQSRMAPALCRDLGQTLLHLCQVVPNGLVVFLPSYSYEGHLWQQWKQFGVLDKLGRLKKVFREPKSAQDLESTLKLYTKHANEESSKSEGGRNGALLLSVIGGKMSEGINLSNSMARGVVIVGLPYGDITDPVLVEKMTNLDQAGVGGITGQAYYQNLCMRAVNQSVGRAIRHAKDYAAVFLCDFRYEAQSHVWTALPKWLRNAPSSPRETSKGIAALTSDLESFFGRMSLEG